MRGIRLRLTRRAPEESMRLADFFSYNDIVPDLAATTKEGVLDELVAKLPERYPEIDREEIRQVLLERELLGSTGIGDGVALPHAKLRHLVKPIVVFGRSKTGIAFDALDGKPVHLFFLLVADMNSVDVYLKLLARISRLLKERALRDRLIGAADADELYGIIGEQDGLL